MSVFVETAVANHDEAEQALDDVEGMLDVGAHLRLRAVFRPLDLVDDAAMTIALVGEVESIGRMRFDHLGLTVIGLVASHPRLIAMQQIGQHLAVGDVGGGGDDGVDDLVLTIDADVRLHAEEPLIALSGLMHVGIARLVAFLVDDGALMIVASTMVPLEILMPRFSR